MIQPFFHRLARHRAGRAILGWILRIRRQPALARLPRPLAVISGPFAGLRYPEHRASLALPRLFGGYEEELHPILTGIIARGYRTIINIGCAEGYYACGLAMRLGEAVVHAFDADPQARAACIELARLNGLSDRVHIRGACEIETLAALPLDGTLIVCDCEGCERELIDPQRAPGLRGADLLVELHDYVIPGISDAIRARFAPTHDVTVVDGQARESFDHPALAGLSTRQRRVALSEFRPPGMQWAWVVRRTEYS